VLLPAAIADLVTHKCLTGLVSVEETSTRPQGAFTEALAAEGSLDRVGAEPTLWSTDRRRPVRPILRVAFDKSSQLTSSPTPGVHGAARDGPNVGRPGMQ
jgi:hypothetical protein